MWRADLDVPKSDLIFDRRMWHFLFGESGDPPPQGLTCPFATEF
jgi:hypothetical protein